MLSMKCRVHGSKLVCVEGKHGVYLNTCCELIYIHIWNETAIRIICQKMIHQHGWAERSLQMTQTIGPRLPTISRHWSLRLRRHRSKIPQDIQTCNYIKRNASYINTNYLASRSDRRTDHTRRHNYSALFSALIKAAIFAASIHGARQKSSPTPWWKISTVLNRWLAVFRDTSPTVADHPAYRCFGVLAAADVTVTTRARRSIVRTSRLTAAR